MDLEEVQDLHRTQWNAGATKEWREVVVRDMAWNAPAGKAQALAPVEGIRVEALLRKTTFQVIAIT